MVRVYLAIQDYADFLPDLGGWYTFSKTHIKDTHCNLVIIAIDVSKVLSLTVRYT